MGVRAREGVLSRRYGLLIALLCALPFSLATLCLPFGRDQGIYSWAGDRLLAGVPLYAGIFAFKPPMTPLVHALSQLLFGHSMMAIRALDVVWTLATVAVLYTFAIRASGSRSWGILAAIWWAYAYHRLDFWTVSQTDGWANLPLAIAFTLVATWEPDETDTRRAIGHATAGFMLGIAFLFKYTLAVYAPFLLIVPVLRHGRAGLRDVGAIVAGGLASLAICAGCLAMTGSLGAFLDTQTRVTLPYTSDLPRSHAPLVDRLSIYFGKFDRLGWIPLVTGAVGLVSAGVIAGRRRDRTDPATIAALALVAWTLGGMFSAWIQAKFFPYHFLPLLAPIALLGSAWPAWLLELAQARTGRRWVVAAGGALITAILAYQTPFPERWEVDWKLATKQATLESQARKYKTRDMSLDTCLKVAAYIRANTTPDEPVFLWGYDPVIYFLAERPQVSRFPYTYPMVVAWSPPEYRDELITALRATPPVVIGVSSRDATPTVMGHSKDSWETYGEFRALKRFVEARYAEPVKIGSYRMYLRADRVSAR